MATVGQRGKWAEGKVRGWMSARSMTDAEFDFYRFPDARAGSFQVVPADFETCCRGTHALIEVKEVKITTVSSRRLPSANFSADKVARMKKRRMAGAEGWVVICHLNPDQPRGPKEWRLVAVDYFFDRAASWDVSGFRVYATVDEVMHQLFGDRRPLKD